jgi:hypothetical protein
MWTVGARLASIQLLEGFYSEVLYNIPVCINLLMSTHDTGTQVRWSPHLPVHAKTLKSQSFYKDAGRQMKARNLEREMTSLKYRAGEAIARRSDEV